MALSVQTATQPSIALPWLVGGVAEPQPSPGSDPSSPAVAELGLEATLLERVAAGDDDAFGVLFDRYSGLMLGLLTRILRRRDLAEEVLQEVWIQIWRRAGRFHRERGSARTWLLMLARSRALDRLRAQTARGRREEVYGGERETCFEPLGFRRIELAETRRRTRRALAAIPSEQRQCIELSFYEGLSHRQIADRLGQPLGTVKSRILLGLRKLRHALET